MRKRDIMDKVQAVDVQEEGSEEKLNEAREKAMKLLENSDHFVLMAVKIREEDDPKAEVQTATATIVAPPLAGIFWSMLRDVQTLLMEMNPQDVLSLVLDEGEHLLAQAMKASKDEEGGPTLH